MQKVNRVIWRGLHPRILLGTDTIGSFFEKYLTIEFVNVVLESGSVWFSSESLLLSIQVHWCVCTPPRGGARPASGR